MNCDDVLTTQRARGHVLPRRFKEFSQFRMIGPFSTFSAGTRTQCQRAELVERARGLAVGVPVPLGSAERTFATAIVLSGVSAVRGHWFAAVNEANRRPGVSIALRWSIRRGVRIGQAKIGWIRSPVDWSSNRRTSTDWTAEKEAHFTDSENKRVHPFSALGI